MHSDVVGDYTDSTEQVEGERPYRDLISTLIYLADEVDIRPLNNHRRPSGYLEQRHVFDKVNISQLIILGCTT